MKSSEVFERWAPAGGRWSSWVKPVVFAHLDLVPSPIGLPATPPVLPQIEIAADGATAVVVDLPGVESVSLGLQLARRGFRPVPLYNAVPVPVLAIGAASHGPVMVDMRGIATELRRGAEIVATLDRMPDAAPAFLLDERRRKGDDGAMLLPGTFDNRSISLPTDFPSANFMLSAGVSRVVVIRHTVDAPQTDVAHTLRRWQDAGICIEMLRLVVDAGPRPIVVTKPLWFRSLWHEMLVRAGLRRHLLGGFGGFIPTPSAG